MNAGIIAILIIIALIPGVYFWYWARENDLGFVAVPAIGVLAACLAGIIQAFWDTPTWPTIGLGFISATTYALLTLLIAAAVDD